MITVTMNIPAIDALTKEVLTPEGVDKMLRECARVQEVLMTQRVHIEGKDSFDRPIGTYSPSYMEVRTKKYNRSGDRKVILSLTRQMENDLSVQDTGTGWGVGYNNLLNYRKATWLQDSTYKKPIWLQTEEEEKATRDTVNKYISDAIR